LVKVQQLFPPREVMDQLLKEDEDQFLRALEKATGPFLREGTAAKKDNREFPEPIGHVARIYVKDLGPDQAAFELGLADPKHLPVLIQKSRRLKAIGLGPLGQGAPIKREAWESLKNFTSLFHETARELELGTPTR